MAGLLSRALPLVLVLGALGGPLAAADPFYANLLGEGTRALPADPARAARLLRTAAFGLLEEPDLLAVALVRLGIAQSRGRDGDGFRDTFDRLLVIEERFGAYRAAELSAQDRAAFEEAVPIHVSEERLRSSPLFSELAERRLELKLSRLPEREQRRELETRVSQQPNDVGRLLAIARFEARQGRPKRAIDWLDRLLAVEPAQPEASCLLGELAAARNDCDRAAPALAGCSSPPATPAAATAQLRCWVRLERWEEAAALMDGLAPALAQNAEIVRLATRIERPVEPPATLEPAPAEADPGPAVESAAPAPQKELPTLQDELTRIRARIAAATTAAELDSGLDEAIALAEAHPESGAAQITAAEAAYRASRWETAARFFDRAPPRADERPLLVFYHSVSLYESGRADEAAVALRAVLPRLARTEFVEAYVERILGS